LQRSRHLLKVLIDIVYFGSMIVNYSVVFFV
jgi:hypothetical protein